jgi:tRNA(fMet)-specific endonuclease VapC
MLQFMLDTNICIYLVKRRPSRLLERFNRHSGQIAVSTITVSELYFGAEKSGRQAENFAALELFFSGLAILPFPKDTALHFAQIRVALQKAGTPIGPYDMLIGAQARAEGLVLVTKNEREFRRIPGLHVENWIE